MPFTVKKKEKKKLLTHKISVLLNLFFADFEKKKHLIKAYNSASAVKLQ